MSREQCIRDDERAIMTQMRQNLLWKLSRPEYKPFARRLQQALLSITTWQMKDRVTDPGLEAYLTLYGEASEIALDVDYDVYMAKRKARTGSWFTWNGLMDDLLALKRELPHLSDDEAETRINQWLASWQHAAQRYGWKLTA